MTDASPIWVIDTSSILDIRGLPNLVRPSVYTRLTALVTDGRLKYPKQVVDELKRGSNPRNPDPPYKWAHENAHLATSSGPSLAGVKAVLAVAPQVLDAKKDSGAEEADPYVLALAVELRESVPDVRVVTNESRDLPNKMSMSTAAGLLAIPSVPLRGFLHAERILAFSDGPA